MAENVLQRMERIGAKDKIAWFMAKEKMPYDFKRRYAALRAREFVRECDRRDLNYHVSVGGLDSIVLALFLRSIHIRCPLISASYLEDKSIQRVHWAIGVVSVHPKVDDDGCMWNKARVLQEFGFPVLSKEIAAKIELLQNPTEKNRTVRHAIITGETGEYGGYQKDSRMKLSQKWLEKFGGYENDTEGVHYQVPDFRVSAKCCYYLKEFPCDQWARENNSVPFLGLMASEGGRRAKSLRVNGCNYFGASTIRSAPFAIFGRQDILSLALEMDAWYRARKDDFYREGVTEKRIRPDFEMPETIIPAVYGTIERDENRVLRTTKAQRTGCNMCGFGIHLEKRPHRFDLLHERNEKEWHYWMYECCTDDDGNHYGWAKVLDYIGVDYQFPIMEVPGQIGLFE